MIAGNSGNGEVTYAYTGTANDGTQFPESATMPTKAGIYKIKITVAETQNYLGGSAETNFTIGRAEINTPNIPSKKANGQQQTADVPASERYTVTENVGGTNNGEYPVLLTLTDYHNYQWVEGVKVSGDNNEIATVSFTISGEENSWTSYPTVADITYGQTVTAQYEAKKGNATVKVSYRTSGGGLLSSAPTAMGSYTAVFSVEGTSEYTSLYVEVLFTINPKAITVTIDNKTSVYREAIVPLTYSVDASELVNGDTAEDLKITLKRETGSNVKAYAITGTDNDANYEIDFIDGVYSITKATYDMSGVTFADKTYTYNGRARNLEISGDLPIGVDVSYEGNGKKNAGTYTVTATFTGDTVNYKAIEEMTAKLYIDKADYDMTGATWNYSEAFEYTGKPIKVGVPLLPDGVIVDAYTGDSYTGAGKYTASVTFAYDTDNYNTPVIADLNWEIKQAPNGWRYSNRPYVSNSKYGDGLVINDLNDYHKFGTYKIEYKAANSDTYTAVQPKDVGSYTIRFYIEETANYTDLEYETSFKIDPREIEVIIDNKTTAYSEAISELTAKVKTGSSLAYDDVYEDLKVRLTKEAGEIIGIYAITGVCENANYKVTFTDGTYEIMKGTYDMSNVKFDDIRVDYDGNAHEIVVTGLPDGVSVEYDVATSYTNAGTYVVTATFTAEDTTNYNALELTEKTATLTINKANYDMSGVKFDNVTVDYDGQAHEIKVTGLPAGVSVEYDVETSYTNAGDYVVTVTFKAEDTTNYNALELTSKTATLTIKKAVYDMSGVVFDSVTVTYDGESHSLAIAGTLPAGVTVTYENNGKTEIGEYAVIAKFTGDAENYETIANKTAKLTIEKKQSRLLRLTPPRLKAAAEAL